MSSQSSGCSRPSAEKLHLVFCIKSLSLLSFCHSCRPCAASCRRPGPERLHPLQPLRRAHLDAAAADGPERSPQRHAAHRGTSPPPTTSIGLPSRLWLLYRRVTLVADDGEEDPVQLQAHPSRQLAAAQAAVHGRSAAGPHRPAGLPMLLCLKEEKKNPVAQF